VQRAVEIFRSVGLQQAVEAAAAREFVYGAIIAVDTLSGRGLACFSALSTTGSRA
jgi:hypothetical protein